ncbi:hypothetical protein GN244_ATG08542 [Phytophthora infestans]|uniref:PiggyBac transposable element-derived protein domain-containing protein n=1 Tax=Phytophthora infestans TaxID=4787 RepID=A0A833TDW0_PHYIN|nr:hypothetical protein GN244_ATG08542 [Phytophthora infestans]
MAKRGAGDPVTRDGLFCPSRGQPGTQMLTNFAQAEFGVSWEEAEARLTASCVEYGTRSKKSDQAMFMILGILHTMTRGTSTWFDSDLKPNTRAYKLLEVIEPILFAKFVKPVTMTQQCESNKTVRNDLYAFLATDVKFQPAYYPSIHFTEKKTHFSGTHKLYGYKLVCSVANPSVVV